MKALGPDTMNPFLQDVLQFFPLLRTLLLAAKQDLLTPVKVLPQVSPPPLPPPPVSLSITLTI